MYIAYVAKSLQEGLIAMKTKKDTPVDLEFGVCDSRFVVSCSFIGDNASLKIACKMLMDRLFAGKTDIAYKCLSKCFKQYCKDNEKEKV